MESNITSKLSETYNGNLVYNGSRSIINTEVGVTRLNNILVKVQFELDEVNYTFRALVSDQQEGCLMIIQDRVTQNHILKGVSGFINDKPNIHGGLISRLNSFYFHIHIQNFNGDQEDIYFIGKDPLEYKRLKLARSKSLLAISE
ncbi:MAG: hypothetical protein RIC35_10965 [Marinoscillum sp.]